MATTTRKKKAKISVDKIDIKKVKKKVKKKVNNAITHLELEDLRQLENLSKDVIIAKMEMNIEEQSLRNMNLELVIMQNKIVSQRDLAKGKADRFEIYKKKYVEYKKTINPKYGLSENDPLGYNPDTGEIIKD
jgi:hypothetical protein